jgi:hypothetical protein
VATSKLHLPGGGFGIKIGRFGTKLFLTLLFLSTDIDENLLYFHFQTKVDFDK